MHAEILAIGDEITSGQLLDTNSQWLSQRLEELGVRVLYHSTVGDELDPLAEVFRLAVSRSDVVVSTGGLGATADDLTRPALAKAVGQELVLNRQALEHVGSMFARRKQPMPPRNERQAMFPSGARMIHNPNGTAPGIDLEVPRSGKSPCRVLCLPGVPQEVTEMWHDSVAKTLKQIGAGRTMRRHKQIKCFGAGESQIESMLPDLIHRGGNPRVGINASKTTIILRITAEGATEQECYAAMEPTIATIRRCLGNLVFGEDDDELQDAVVRLLRQQQKTLATAEWGTAGLVADWLGGVPRAEGCYRGGLVAVSQPALQQGLGLDPDLLARHSTTGPEVAEAMAAACRERFEADFGLSVGRFPSFDPGASDPKPVCFALATRGGVAVTQFPYAAHPAMLKILCAKRALNIVRLAMLGAT